MHTLVSAHITTEALALVCHALVADSEKAREETSLVGGKDNTEKFGPLKSVLGNVPALYANSEVCLQPPTLILLRLTPRRSRDAEVISYGVPLFHLYSWYPFPLSKLDAIKKQLRSVYPLR